MAQHIEGGERRTITIFAGVLAFLCLSFMLVMNWDIHSLAVIPLKIKETVGASNPADIERMGEICMDLKKWDCVESNYSQAAAHDPQQLTRLGQFQMKRAKWQAAAQTYYRFFQSGGQDLDASYNYAKALSQLGEVDEAVKYFDMVLAAKPDVRQVTVVQNYVKLLMDHQRYDQARALIQGIRKQGPDSSLFMETEYKKIQDMATASRD
jgi:tetratricopeptide (TPR) repeat protein